MSHRSCIKKILGAVAFLVLLGTSGWAVDKGFGLQPEPQWSAPVITHMTVNGKESSLTQDTIIKPGDLIILEGSGFGEGPNVDLSKVMVGQVRALERDLIMLPGTISISSFLKGSDYFVERKDQEILNSVIWPQIWKADLLPNNWTDKRIAFTVPVTASRGPIVVQVQKRRGWVPSLVDRSQRQLTPDPILERVNGYGGEIVGAKGIGLYGSPQVSNPVPVEVQNADFKNKVSRGEQIYWGFDYNTGMAQSILRVDWPALLKGKVIDHRTGKPFNPAEQIGAIPARQGQVPAAVMEKLHFDHSPMPSPLLRDANHLSPVDLSDAVDTSPTGWVGYVWAKPEPIPAQLFSVSRINNLMGAHVGFNCAACHARQISYQNENGQEVTRVFNGIPNPKWSMKFAALKYPLFGTSKELNVLGASGFEKIDGHLQKVDKTELIYNVYPGTADMTLIRSNTTDHSFYHNDFLYSPTAIPVITRHTPVRRALSRSEAIAGFEGSYLHSQEPDGALGVHSKEAIQALTAYVSTLDSDHSLLVKLGLYRWLAFKGKTDEVGSVTEGEFLRSQFSADTSVFSENQNLKLQGQIEKGRQVFEAKCVTCHASNFGTNTDENMMPLSTIGTYFSPTVWQRQTGSIRTAMIRELFWVQQRGLLHDGHIRSSDKEHLDSVDLLVRPERCDENSALYKKMYTLNEASFHIPKGSGTPQERTEQERATRAHHYFVDLPQATAEQSNYLYWDYQTMRRNFGSTEFGSKTATPLPATPHGYCVTSEEVDPLIHYLLTL